MPVGRPHQTVTSTLPILLCAESPRLFSAVILDQLPLLLGDRSGHCHVEVTRCYFRNPVFVIAGDDNFANKG